MRSATRRKVVFGGVLVLALGVARPASAQDVAAAEALFRRGLADMKAGRFEPGCAALAESYRLDRRLGALFTLAACRAQAGQAATASALFDDYLRWYEQLPPAQRATQRERLVFARRRQAELAPRIARLTLRLPASAPAATVVRRDGVVLGAPALGSPLPVDPGVHTLVTEAPGARPLEQRVELAPGEEREIVLLVAPVEPPAASAPVAAPPARPLGAAPAPHRVDWQRPVAYGLGALGALGLAAGATTGALALDRRAIVERLCEGAGCREQAGVDAAERGRSFAAWSTTGFVAGGTALAAAALLWLSAPDTAASEAASGPRVGLRGGVGPVTFVGLGGAW